MKIIFAAAFVCLSLTGYSQFIGNTDSLKLVLKTSNIDSVKYRAARALYVYYEEINKDSAYLYSQKCLDITIRNHQQLAEVNCLNNKAYTLIGLGRFAESLQCLLESFKIVENKSLDKEVSWQLFSGLNYSPFNGNNRLLMQAYTHHIFGILMWRTNDQKKAIFHFAEARKISIEIDHVNRQMMASMNLGRSYFEAGRLDSVLFLEKEAADLAIAVNQKKYLGQIYSTMANVYYKQKDTLHAQEMLNASFQISENEQNFNNLNVSCFMLASLYIDKRQKDSALFYALRNREIIEKLGFANGLVVNLGMIYDNIYKAYQLYDKRDSVYKYMQLALVVKDSLNGLRIKTLAAFQNAILDEQLRLQHSERDKLAFQSKVKVYGLLSGLAIFLLIAFILYRNNREKQKANLVLKNTLSDLKSTQSQLIQSEKMASLGELTAGIAHEIQNPLNFVNNFSEVSTELIDEINVEIDRGNFDDVKDIAGDLKQNLEKINHHGKRAGDIVKGMLQHSRSSSGLKEPTDINALTDEYLRLAYHGLRAKDIDFNATMKTDFDKSIGKIKIIPQDIGRVILNLITNAFYAVNEKSKQGIADYEPTVSVSTKKVNDKVEIKVTDNGNGIPANILDKIFQPFFTTKPTGQGTGLGLSLSYDIVKAHGGELKVETKEGERSTFIIHLPMNS
jgi:two-component system, NtrC family, sensor kinase